ncbi:site-specific integrase [Sporosarcina sp. P37]|uniref:site-specific integrase n=1 Tax=unclassified Sporosarcina TaxID=2647733 RepID=UPI000A17EA34|nr:MULTISPECIES: site-specific integrase [unclassified Sporosarcina]ARK25990.1 site-specific integrase [Sporosarcina sp. P37]PID19360.1 site-specific integrase [Sporosarcina sp. P35]
MNFVQPIRDIEKVREVRSILKQKSDRNELLFCFGIYTGLRISDILRLKIKDVRGKSALMVREQKTIKTNRAKRIPVMPELQKMIERYVAHMPDDEYLFKSRQGRNSPITRVQAYNILRDAAQQAELKEIGTHTMRKTFGYHIYQATKNVALLQDIFGHSSEYITLKYIGVNQDAIEAAYRMLKF